MIDRSQYGRFAGHPALGAAEYKLSVRPRDGAGRLYLLYVPRRGGDRRRVGGGRTGCQRNERICPGCGKLQQCAAGRSRPGGFWGRRLCGGSSVGGNRFPAPDGTGRVALGGGGYRAPIQLTGDFLAGRASTGLGDVKPSYLPGVTPSDLRECLPGFVADSLRAALPALGRQLAGFDRPDAVLTGVESRSSSPVRILRDEKAQASVAGIFPAARGPAMRAASSLRLWTAWPALKN